MARFTRLSVLTLIAAFANVVAAADSADMAIGGPAPKFDNLPAVDGKSYSLGDFKQDLLVFCVTCNHCPVAEAYEQRLINFSNKYATGKDAKVAFVAVCVSDMDVDKLDKMKVRAKDSKLNFTYLYDGSQNIGKQLNAHVTPEFYVFDKSRKLVYWGAMDDNMDASKVTERYLEPAVEAALTGKAAPKAQTKAFGCAVMYNK